MKKLLLLLLCLAFAMDAGAQTSAALTGNLKKLNGATPGTLNTKLEMEFRTPLSVTQSVKGCPSGFLRVVGTGIPVDDHQDYIPDDTGLVAGNLYRTDALNCGGHTNGFYRAYIITEGAKKTYCDFFVTGTVFDLNTAVCDDPTGGGGGGGGVVFSPDAVLKNPTGSQVINQYNLTLGGVGAIFTAPVINALTQFQLNGVNFVTVGGYVNPALLGSGTPTSSTCLLGNGTWGLCDNFVAGGDLSGTITSQNVIKFDFSGTHLNLGLAPTTGQCLSYDGSTITGAACDNFVAGGDLSGTITSQNVIKLDFSGTHLNLGLAPITGQCLSYDGSTVTGAACDSFVAGGDLSGTITSQNVVALHFGTTRQPTSSVAPTTGQCLKWNGSSIIGDVCGSVTSVGLSMPGDFSVSGSPVTSSGTLAVTYANQSHNTALMGPAAFGASAAAPTFRAHVPQDMTFAANPQTVTTYTVSATDNGKLVFLGGTSPVTVTLPRPSTMPANFNFGIQTNGPTAKATAYDRSVYCQGAGNASTIPSQAGLFKDSACTTIGGSATATSTADINYAQDVVTLEQDSGCLVPSAHQLIRWYWADAGGTIIGSTFTTDFRVPFCTSIYSFSIPTGAVRLYFDGAWNGATFNDGTFIAITVTQYTDASGSFINGSFSDVNIPAGQGEWFYTDGSNYYTLTGLFPYILSGNTTTLATVAGTLTSGNCVKIDASGNFVDAGVTCGGGVGTVTSVGMSVPSWLTVAGSPVTSSGTFAVTATGGQTANEVLATPSGSTGAVGLRVLVGADLPLFSSTLPGAVNLSGGGTVNFLRADGTWAAPPTGTGGASLLNGSIDPASGTGSNGDFYINTTSWKIFGPKATGSWPAGVSIVGPAGTFAGRVTSAHTTISIANNAYEESTVALAKSFLLIQVQVSAYSRVELYATNSAMVADRTRAIGIPPTAGTSHGVLGDWVLNSTGLLTFICSPPVYGANAESTPSTNVSIRITNMSGSTTTITATFTYNPLET